MIERAEILFNKVEDLRVNLSDLYDEYLEDDKKELSRLIEIIKAAGGEVKI